MTLDRPGKLDRLDEFGKLDETCGEKSRGRH